MNNYLIPPEPSPDGLLTRGTRILAGQLAKDYYSLQACCFAIAKSYGCQPIVLPTIEPSQLYVDKAGEEVLKQMYCFKDQGDRDLCLRPEATATCQRLAQTTYKTYQNLGLFYWQKCFRYERPQAGRYREFTQFGVEILNPTAEFSPDELIEVAEEMISTMTCSTFVTTRGVKRGLGIYNAEGFEISIETLGAQKQVVGGGPYENGYGFAIGIDRMLLTDIRTL